MDCKNDLPVSPNPRPVGHFLSFPRSGVGMPLWRSSATSLSAGAVKTGVPTLGRGNQNDGEVSAWEETEVLVSFGFFPCVRTCRHEASPSVPAHREALPMTQHGCLSQAPAWISTARNSPGVRFASKIWPGCLVCDCRCGSAFQARLLTSLRFCRGWKPLPQGFPLPGQNPANRRYHQLAGPCPRVDATLGAFAQER